MHKPRLSPPPLSSHTLKIHSFETGKKRGAFDGFFSVHAALGLAQVGEHLASSLAPVWVAYGESHYSLIFAAPERAAWPAQRVGKRRTFGLNVATPVREPEPSEERDVGEALAAGRAHNLFDVVV